jgi:hypothetical protein
LATDAGGLMKIIDVRARVAELLSEIEDVHVRERCSVKIPRLGDGWVSIVRMTPEAFRQTAVAFNVVVILGQDALQAEELLDLWGPQLVRKISTDIELPVGDVKLEPITIGLDNATELNALVLSFTLEVDDE